MHISLLPVRIPIFLALSMLASCSGAQTRDGGSTSGRVDAVLRRIDVVEAGYSEMKLAVVVAIDNGTDGDVPVAADIELSILGPGAADEAIERKDGAEPDAALDTDGVEVVVYKGSAKGTAPAANGSELSIPITLPLPSDPGVLERFLAWPKVRILVKGNGSAGMTQFPIGGEREIVPPRIPAITLKGAQVAKLDGGTGGEAFFVLLLTNPNPFGVSVDKINWKIIINDKEVKKSDDIVGGQLPPNSVEEYNETVELNERLFDKAALRTMLKAPSVPYTIEGSMQIRGIFEEFRFTGEMKFSR
jgi:LEA14-like dessication related protein